MSAYGIADDPTIWTDSANLSYWQGQSKLSGTDLVECVAPDYGFSRCQLVFNRTTPSGFREDVMVTHMDWVLNAGGEVSKLGASEMAEVETALNTFHDNVAGLFPSSHTLAYFIWHDYSPISTRPGPAVRTTTTSKVGSAAASRMPDQISITTTYHTASRLHWGRSYWPMNAVANLDTTYGRVSDTRCGTLGTHMDTLLGTNGTGDAITPVVTSIQYHGCLNIRELVVDNVFDIQRRRRAKFASFRSTQSE